MALEIERRFLVSNTSWRELTNPGIQLRQAYLATGHSGWTIRIRINDKNQAWITLKAPAEKISSHEFEYPIAIKDAEEIWELALYRLHKIRYQLNLDHGEWIVDSFEGDNSPLTIAEVELSSPSQMIEIPPWCGQEITGQTDLSNAALAQNPFNDWPDSKRRKNGLT